MRNVLQVIKCFLLMIIMLLLLLIIASAIPNSWLNNNQRNALAILEREGTYPRYFFNSASSQQDNSTDAIIIQQAINDEKSNVFEKAMHKTYARYWHGYCIYVRPLLVFFSLYQIRYLLMLLCFFLLGGATILIAKKIDNRSSLSFAFANGMVFLVVVATSLQFLPVFIISYIAIIVELLFPAFVEKKDAVFFMGVGMVTSFIDLLTAPIITLGLPLIIYLLMKKGEGRIQYYSKTIISNTIMWTLGYGGTWSSKWLIGSLILKTNIFKDAAMAISFRTMGNDEYEGALLSDRFKAIVINFRTMFIPEGKPAAVAIVIIIIISIITITHKTKDTCKRVQALSILIIGTYPYLWYFVLSNHSLLHMWFTYRSQVVTIFAVLTCLLRLADFPGRKLVLDKTDNSI